jgi:UDP:flavonoid glycosyltransferase YjiC (YdhE family)
VVSGALGGVAAALTAGVPVVIHPQLFDQVWHGRRVEQLGVGIMARKVADVGTAVRRIVDDPAYTARATALAAEMKGEDGARALADAVESVL